MRLGPLITAAICTLGIVAAPVRAAELAAHRALYSLTMVSSRGDVTGATGTMSFEALDACEGWTVRQRLAMTLTNRDGQDVEMVSDYATYETKDGLSLRFHMRQTTDGNATSDVAGDASLERAGGAGKARYTAPEKIVKPLPAGTLFPMAHTEAILAAARAGKRLIALPLFDGTSADGVQDSSIAIANWLPPAPGKWPDLNILASGRMQLAFFERGGSGQPDYEVGMRYWDNGVSDELTMNFGDFIMRGVMKEFTLMPKGC